MAFIEIIVDVLCGCNEARTPGLYVSWGEILQNISAIARDSNYYYMLVDRWRKIAAEIEAEDDGASMELFALYIYRYLVQIGVAIHNNTRIYRASVSGNNRFEQKTDRQTAPASEWFGGTRFSIINCEWIQVYCSSRMKWCSEYDVKYWGIGAIGQYSYTYESDSRYILIFMLRADPLLHVWI